MTEQSKWVIITGSGRSGTSSVGGTLKRLGLHIPQPEVEADEKNPRGYYEPAWLAALLKDFMDPIPVRTIDSRPHAPQVAMEALAETDIEDQLREWLRDLLVHPQVAIKDTRAYWVYPMFVRLAEELGAELTSLTMLRHPTEVVRSRETAYLSGQSQQFRRERETTNVAAWMNAAFETERVTRHHARAFVRYPDLRSDWRAAMGRAGDQLGLTYNADLTSDEHHLVDDFIDAGLFRSRVTWDDIDVSPALKEMAEQVWTAMNALVESPHDEQAIGELARLRAEYVDLYAFASAMAQDERTAQVVAVRREMRGRIEAKQARIEQLKVELAKARALPPATEHPGWQPRVRRAVGRLRRR
ncbi:MAG: hypothetical protein ABIQ15_09170 [Nocardioides sp.]